MTSFGSSPSPYSKPLRLSDSERSDAINDLARAVGEGRLSMEEFEARSDDVLQATTRAELTPIFKDIPVPTGTQMQLYSKQEIERARVAGRKPRLATAMVGTMGLGFVGTSLLILANSGGGVVLGLGALTLIPILWVLLYVAKIGPASWHTPSPRQIEREQKREIRALTAAQRAEQKAIEAQMWAERRQQAGEITGQAMSLAQRKFEKWSKN